MMPQVYPSIDISEGRAVKRVRGVRGTGLDLGDPLKWVEFWANEGAKGIHVVDLDAAETGRPVNSDIILKIIKMAKELGLWVQVAGGIRSVEHASLYSDADAIVVGSKAHKDPSFVDVLSKEIGADKIIIALDLKGGRVSIEGWKETLPKGLHEALKLFEDKEFKGFMYTYIDTEGTMRGPDVAGCKYIKSTYPSKLLEYAGGVGSKDDVKALGNVGVDVVVIGMALYTGKIKLKDLV